MAELEHISDITEKLKHKSNLGGARPGAGRPKGSKDLQTIEREEAARQFRERVAKNTHKLFNAQLDLAVGEKYLMVIHTNGKGSRAKRETSIVTDLELIKKYLDEELEDTDDDYYFMTTKPANNQALEGMLNRTFGKAPETIDVTSNGETISNLVALPIKKSDNYDTDDLDS